ncbi:MAG: hypothetical protein M5U12_19160 [Verrucomicrobia bacterium]|nr:hypothetical protein [Verrucomicrobiota bacterium]
MPSSRPSPGPLQNARFDPIVDGRFAALAANGINVANPRPIKTWVTQRRNYLANRIATFDTPEFVITSNNGNPFATDQPFVSLTGARAAPRRHPHPQRGAGPRHLEQCHPVDPDRAAGWTRKPVRARGS